MGCGGRVGSSKVDDIASVVGMHAVDVGSVVKADVLVDEEVVVVIDPVDEREDRINIINTDVVAVATATKNFMVVAWPYLHESRDQAYDRDVGPEWLGALYSCDGNDYNCNSPKNK
eukprot:2336448-Amphidinium_carterae.1